MPEGGRVCISAENVPSNAKLPHSLKHGRYVRISIRDSGCGIPEKNLKSIFTPFFTTKQQGSGLGLATSCSIVAKHNGYLGVESAVGKGTTFFFYLPAYRRGTGGRQQR
jgi:signal transduction histidine kinase